MHTGIHFYVATHYAKLDASVQIHMFIIYLWLHGV